MKVELNKADVAKVNFMLAGVKNAAPRVLSRTINKTITSSIGYSAKEVVKHYNLTEKRVRQDASRTNAMVAKISGNLSFKGKPVSLPTFKGTRQTAKGVSVQIKKDNPRWVWRHAFIRIVKNSKQAWYRPTPPVRSSRLYKVWKRSDKYGVLPHKYRYGLKGIIYRLTGPRVEDELGKERTIEPVLKQTGDRMKTVMDQELNFELSKL